MRWNRLLGLAFLVLIWAGEIAGSGSHPAPTAPARTIAAFYVQYRTEQLVGVYLQAVASLVLVVLAAVLSVRLRDAGATVVLVAAGAALTAAAFSGYVALNGGLAFGIGSDAAADVTRAVYQLRAVAETMISFPAALLVGSVAVATHRLRAAGRWYPVSSGLVAAVLLVSGADFARSGFFAVNGDLSFLSFFVLFPLWAAVSGFVLLRK